MKSRRAFPNFSRCACRRASSGKLKMLPKLAEMGAFFPKIVSGGPCKDSDPARGFFARRFSDPEMLAGGWRPVHHAADGVFEQSGYGQAQLRLLSAAGFRRAHHRDALADAQAGRRALSANARAGETKRMDVAVAIGADPATMYSAILPLPPDLDEMMIAGFLR